MWSHERTHQRWSSHVITHHRREIPPPAYFHRTSTFQLSNPHYRVLRRPTCRRLSRAATHNNEFTLTLPCRQTTSQNSRTNNKRSQKMMTFSCSISQEDASSCGVWFQLTVKRHCSQRRLVLTQPSRTASSTHWLITAVIF